MLKSYAAKHVSLKCRCFSAVVKCHIGCNKLPQKCAKYDGLLRLSAIPDKKHNFGSIVGCIRMICEKCGYIFGYSHERPQTRISAVIARKAESAEKCGKYGKSCTMPMYFQF